MSTQAQFIKGKIHDVVVKPLAKYLDERGWLAELYRADEIAPEFLPAMAYISMTRPGIARGPHEHREQADCFAFIGPSNFKVYLWDAREDSPTSGVRQVIFAGGTVRRCSLSRPAWCMHTRISVGRTASFSTHPTGSMQGRENVSPLMRSGMKRKPAHPSRLISSLTRFDGYITVLFRKGGHGVSPSQFME